MSSIDKNSIQLKHKKSNNLCLLFASYFPSVKWYHYNTTQLLSQEAIKNNCNSKYFHNSSQIVSSYIVIGGIIIYQYFIIIIYLRKRTSSKRIDFPPKNTKIAPKLKEQQPRKESGRDCDKHEHMPHLDRLNLVLASCFHSAMQAQICQSFTFSKSEMKSLISYEISNFYNSGLFVTSAPKEN